MTLRVALSVGEILVLVAVLAYFVRRLTTLLARVGDSLEEIVAGVRAVESHCAVIGPGVKQVNGLLKETAANLDQAAAAAERL